MAVECLANERVEYVFQLPGEETLALTDSLARSKRFQLITVRHEQSAAFMAGVFGRLTGHAGVCLATLGPGATNLVTGVADAHIDRAPVVALTGQASLEQVHKEYHQYVDVVSIFRPVTKWNTRIQKTGTIPESFRKAFSIAETEKPGACHIELPEDIVEDSADSRPIPVTYPDQPAPLEPRIKKAAELVNQSNYPLIMAGNGVIRGKAGPSLRKLVDHSKIAVAHTFMGKGAVPDDNPLSLLAIGFPGKQPVNAAFQEADLVIAIGYDFVEYSPSIWNASSDKTIVHIDTTPTEIDSNYQPAVQLVGEIAKTLETLTQFIKPRPTGYTSSLRDAIIEDVSAGSRDESFPMKPQRVLHDLRKALGPEDILVSDVGAHKLWVSRVFPAHEPNTVIISNGYSSMGIGLPGAIAAKLVHPNRHVVAVCGDGGFMMTVHELETAVRLGVGIVIVVFRDGAYGSIRSKQLSRYGREASVSFGNPDFLELARAFKARGYRPEKASDIGPIFEEAIDQAGASIVDVPVDYSENFTLFGQ